MFLPLTVGGGVRSTEDIRRLLLAGADKCSMNSAAVARPDLVREAARKFGSQCVVVAVDAKRTSPDGWEVYTHGGRRPTGLDAVAWCRQVVALGAGEILLTSMDRDGTGRGFDLVRILTEPSNALTRQYSALLGTEQVTLDFTPDGIRELVAQAYRVNEEDENLGARRLFTIMEKVLEDVSFGAEELAGTTIVVDAAYVGARLGDLVMNQDLRRYVL